MNYDNNNQNLHNNMNNGVQPNVVPQPIPVTGIQQSGMPQEHQYIQTEVPVQNNNIGQFTNNEVNNNEKKDVIIKIIIAIVAIIIGGLTVYIRFIVPVIETKKSVETARENALVVEANQIKREAQTQYVNDVIDGKIKSTDTEICYPYEQLKTTSSNSDSKDTSKYSGSVLITIDRNTGDEIYKVWFSNGIYKIVTKNSDGSVSDGATESLDREKNVEKGKITSNNCGK